MKQYIDKIKEFGEFIEKNKILITSSVYGLGVAFQLIMLMSYSGFQGFFYVSLKFSIILFIILLFLFLISIPIFFLFLIFIFILSIIFLLLLGIIGYISIGLFLTLIVIIALIKKYLPNYFLNLQKYIRKKTIFEKFDKFSSRYLILVFILIFISFSYSVFGKKIVILNTQDNKVIMGELKFYNQEYYFLEVCKNKIILPANEIKSVNMLGNLFYFSQKENKDKLNKINTDYNNYCNVKNIQITK